MQDSTAPKKYRLLKPLPDADAGTIVTLDKDDESYDYKSKKGEDCWYRKHWVEDNTEWFEPVEQGQHEKIEVSRFGKHDTLLGNKWDSLFYQFCASKLIPEDKFPAIKEAVERVLNDNRECAFDEKKLQAQMEEMFRNPKKYTQEQYDKAIIDAGLPFGKMTYEMGVKEGFNAAREYSPTPGTHVGTPPFFYKTVTDYLSTKQSPSKPENDDLPFWQPGNRVEIDIEVDGKIVPFPATISECIYFDKKATVHFCHPRLHQTVYKSFPFSELRQPSPSNTSGDEKKDWEVVAVSRNGANLNVQAGSEFQYVPEDTIRTVRRLSDSQVFTVGDEMNVTNFYGHAEGHIEKIEVSALDKTDILFTIKTDRPYSFKQYLSKIPAKPTPTKEDEKTEPLFVTEDGVKIFEGDEYWWVCLLDEESEKAICLDKKWQVGKGKASDATVTSRNYKHFSTEANLNEYLLNHKPCLSVNDVLNISYTDATTGAKRFGKSALMELAKTKQQ